MPMIHKEQKIAECLNRLCAINLGGTSNDDIKGFITDYFGHDSDLDEPDEEHEGKFCHELHLM